MTIQFLVYVVTTLFTYIAGKVSKYYDWNYTVIPIQIQNLIIIAIVSIIGILIHIENLDADAIIQAVITAVGGVGTAVVAYDAKNL